MKSNEEVLDTLLSTDLIFKRVKEFRGLCACMGPGYGEPYCPCEMDRRGLLLSEEHTKAI